MSEELEETLPENLDDKASEDLHYYTKRKLVVNWNDEDGKVIADIKDFAQEVYFSIFGDTFSLIADLYEKTNDGDNWGLLSTGELEGYSLKLSQQKVQTSVKINSIKLDALFAKYALDDDYHQSYLHANGTNNLREAKAHTDTVEKRYAYFFRFAVHTLCDGLAKEIDGLIRNLNSVLYRRGSNG